MEVYLLENVKNTAEVLSYQSVGDKAVIYVWAVGYLFLGMMHKSEIWQPGRSSTGNTSKHAVE